MARSSKRHRPVRVRDVRRWIQVPALAATFAASFGFMLPVSTPQNAIVYGSGVVPITKMIRSGISFDVIGAILIIIFLPLMVAVVGIGS